MSDRSFDSGQSPDETGSCVLTWDEAYAIALALDRAHPNTDLGQVSLGMIYRWTLALAEFADDPQLVNEEILSAIYQEWLEEVISK